MPPRRRRAGYRRGVLSEEFQAALEAERQRLESAAEPIESVKGVGDFFAQLDRELEKVADVRRKAVRELRQAGWTYQRISEASGLSMTRIAQLAHETRTGGRASRKKS